MSPKNPPLIVGLAAPGLLWLATSVAPGQDLPPAPPGPPTKAPTSLKTYRVLLLSSGKVVEGEISHDPASGLYRLRSKGGAVVYEKNLVLAAGESFEDIYRFQVARLPQGDPDERMKLARWCLTYHLTPQAKEQLEAIQAMCPDDAEVRRMLYNLASAGEPSSVDPALRRTSGDEMPARGEAPATLDPRVIVKAQKRFSALPEIFDLPQAQAVKKANEFADYVQPVLQQSCVKCHNEKYQGSFQLVEIKIRRDQTNPDIARANLDATLRLINPDDPARSELLSAGLVPHGGSKSAIFRGPNDRSYQVLSQWTRSLRPGGSKGSQAGARGFGGEGVSRTGYAPADDAGVAFGSERSGRAGASTPDRAPLGSPVPPPRAMTQQYDENAEFVNAPGDNPQFLVPFAAGGAPTYRPPAPIPKGKVPATAKTPAPGSPATASPAPGKKMAVPVAPGAVVVATDDPNELPGMDQPRYPPKPEADPDNPVDKDKKPAKSKPIDNALLEKMMRNRNGGTP
jgi:hypothetical protein